MMAAVIAKLLPMSEREATALEPHLRPVQKNWNGMTVGHMRPAAELSSLPA
jgi:hypothetical protein